MLTRRLLKDLSRPKALGFRGPASPEARFPGIFLLGDSVDGRGSSPVGPTPIGPGLSVTFEASTRNGYAGATGSRSL
jgi:hypothetical protein